MRNVLTVLGFLVAFGFANYLTTRSWNGTVYVYMGERRAPASVRKSTDYTPIDRKALYRSVHAQLMAEAQTVNKDGYVGIRLGHPIVMREEGGGRDFACQVAGHSGVFDRMQVTFYGTGISDSGNEPHMVIDTACRASTQLDALDTIWVPMQDIVSSNPKDQEVQVSGDRPAMIRFENIPGAWPENWVLISVRFYREDSPDQELVVDAKHLHEAGPTMLSFQFKPNLQHQ